MPEQVQRACSFLSSKHHYITGFRSISRSRIFVASVVHKFVILSHALSEVEGAAKNLQAAWQEILRRKKRASELVLSLSKG